MQWNLSRKKKWKFIVYCLLKEFSILSATFSVTLSLLTCNVYLFSCWNPSKRKRKREYNNNLRQDIQVISVNCVLKTRRVVSQVYSCHERRQRPVSKTLEREDGHWNHPQDNTQPVIIPQQHHQRKIREGVMTKNTAKEIKRRTRWAKKWNTVRFPFQGKTMKLEDIQLKEENAFFKTRILYFTCQTIVSHLETQHESLGQVFPCLFKETVKWSCMLSFCIQERKKLSISSKSEQKYCWAILTFSSPVTKDFRKIRKQMMSNNWGDNKSRIKSWIQVEMELVNRKRFTQPTQLLYQN